MRTGVGFFRSNTTWTFAALSVASVAISAPGCSEEFTCSDLRNCKPKGGAAGITGGAAGESGSGNGNSNGGTGTPKGGSGGAGGNPTEHPEGGETTAGGTSAGGEPGATSGGATSGGAGGTLSEAGAGGAVIANGGALAGGKVGSGGALATGGSTPNGGTTSVGGSLGAGGGSGGTVSCTAGQCAAQCPCSTIGQGTCVDSTGCGGGLVCGVGTGAKFGLSGNTCVPKHCDDNVVNADETSVDCGGECGCKAEFTRLGFLWPSNSMSAASDVNADGSVVVGRSRDAPGSTGSAILDRPFRWARDAGMQRLSDAGAFAGGKGSRAIATSSDGTVVVGNVDASSSTLETAYTWTKATGSLAFTDGSLPTTARAVSADGGLAVGQTTYSSATAWGPSANILQVGNVGPGASDALGVSSDATAVVGWATDSNGVNRAIVWRSTGHSFLDAASGVSTGRAISSSKNAAIVVGSLSPGGASSAQRRAAVWSLQGGSYSAFAIDDLPGGSDSNEAIDVSGDGSVLVGWGTSESGKEPFIWDKTKGVRSLVDELRLNGYEWPMKVSLGDVAAISADGTTIVGSYQNPEGLTEAWRIVVR